ncbi:MAG: hypothetical protein ACPGWM_10805 [Flavobacteriales bacterium]
MRITFLFAILLLTGVVNSQITVEEFQIKMTVDVAQMNQLDPIKASSTCGAVNISSSEMRMSGGCLGTIVRTTTITDECGNSEEVQQFFNLTDNEGPVFTNVPENIEVAKNQVPAADVIEAQDNSQRKVKIELQEKELKGSIVRTWTATDQCGNTTVKQQIIKLKKS